MADWDTRYMALAGHVAAWSKDRSRQVGCIVVDPDNLVRAIGYNGFPRQVDDERDDRHERPAKYLWTEHAERNAIYAAARIGVSLKGCRIYLPWFPCMDCARAIVQTGIVELICIKPDPNEPRWAVDFAEVPQLLLEAGVVIRWWSKPSELSHEL